MPTEVWSCLPRERTPKHKKTSTAHLSLIQNFVPRSSRISGSSRQRNKRSVLLGVQVAQPLRHCSHSGSAAGIRKSRLIETEGPHDKVSSRWGSVDAVGVMTLVGIDECAVR